MKLVLAVRTHAASTPQNQGQDHSTDQGFDPLFSFVKTPPIPGHTSITHTPTHDLITPVFYPRTPPHPHTPHQPTSLTPHSTPSTFNHRNRIFMGLAVSTKSRLEEPAYSRQATASLHKAIPLSRRRLKRKATKLFLGHRQPSPVPRGVATSQPTLGSGILTRFPFGGMFSSNQRREKRTRGSKE